MRHWFSVMIAGLLLAAPAMAKEEAPRKVAGNPDRGMFLFTTYCTACHGDEGKGDGPMAPRLVRDFKALPTDFSNPAWQNSRSDKDITTIIRSGGKAAHRSQFMPAWGLTLTEGQVTDLLAFIRDLSHESSPTNPRVSTFNVQDRLELGRTLYTLYCVACHGRKGQGDGPLIETADSQGQLKKRPPDFTSNNFMLNRSDAEIHLAAQSAPGHSKLELQTGDSSWWHRPLTKHELDSLTFFLRANSLVHQKAQKP